MSLFVSYAAIEGSFVGKILLLYPRVLDHSKYSAGVVILEPLPLRDIHSLPETSMKHNLFGFAESR